MERNGATPHRTLGEARRDPYRSHLLGKCAEGLPAWGNTMSWSSSFPRSNEFDGVIAVFGV